MPGLYITIGRSFRRQWLFALSVALGVVVPGAGPTLAHEEHGHPTRIHEGTCEALGPVAVRLNGVGGSVDIDNAPVATPTAINPDSAYQVMVSETTVDGTIEDLLAAEHAVMIYESDEAMEAIACGPIGGAMSGDTLITGLAEMGVPGHLGIALFRPEGDGLAVSLIIGHGMAPVSAAGQQVDHEDDEGAADDHEDTEDDHAHAEEDGHDAAATPEA